MYRLLIADDDDSVREDVRTLLPWADYGFDTLAEADSYVTAMDRAMDVRPHAALVSVRLGVRWGADLIEQLRAAGLRTAFCVISDHDEPEHIRRAMRAGAKDFLLKPLDPTEVLTFLKRCLPPGVSGARLDLFAARSGMDPILGVDRRTLSPLTNKILLMANNGLDYPPATLISIAENLHMNSKYLGRVFLRETGMKLSEYMTACRMERARRLVTGTQEKISVIANMVGYSQLNRFYVHFRNYFGISPGALRSVAPPPEIREDTTS